MVAGHCELGVLFFYEKVVQVFLLRELISEADAVVVDPEAQRDIPVCRSLIEVYGKLVVVVAYGGSLSPHWCPRLVEGRCLGVFHGEAVHQVGFLELLACVLVLGQLQSEARGLHHILAFVGHAVGRHAAVGQLEVQFDLSVGRLHGLCRHGHWYEQRGNDQFKIVHVFLFVFVI